MSLETFHTPHFIIDTETALKKALAALNQSLHAYRPSTSMLVLLQQARHLKSGSLHVTLPDGKTLLYQGRNAGKIADITIRNDRIAKRFLAGGKLAFCEGYLDGDWTSNDIPTLFELVLENESEWNNTLLGRTLPRLLAWVQHKFKPNSKKGARANIYAHYDLGNDFYQAWLDPSMTYSSAFYSSQKMTLSEAQTEKYQAIADSIGIEQNHHILEIGCGWGGFAEFAAKTYGCKITCVTISKAQFEFATARIKNAGLENLVEIKLQDYRDVQGTFDRIVSIEMFEAVGETYWRTYFHTLKNLLRQGGRAALQIITINENDFPLYRLSADYIQKYIFPGGMLPTVRILQNLANSANLDAYIPNRFGQDYARTLQAWNTKFQDKWSDLQTLHPKFDIRFKRMWELYFYYCIAGFNAGCIDVCHVTLQKGV